MKNSARGDSSTGSELKAVEEACREASRTVEPCVLCVSVVKPISDLRLLISGLCAMLLALCFSADVEEAFSYRMTGKDKRDVKRIIFEYFEYIEREWDKFAEKKR